MCKQCLFTFTNLRTANSVGSWFEPRSRSQIQRIPLLRGVYLPKPNYTTIDQTTLTVIRLLILNNDLTGHMRIVLTESVVATVSKISKPSY